VGVRLRLSDVSQAIDKAAGARSHDGHGFNAAGIGESNGGSKFRSDHPDYVKPKGVTEAAQQWQGWGTALKPAHEPICVARKPLIGTVAANVLHWGTGAFNIDGCRVDATDKTPAPVGQFVGSSIGPNGHSGMRDGSADALGRWPANLIHDGSDGVLDAFPDAKGQQGDLTGHANTRGNGIYGDMAPAHDAIARVETEKSAARFFYCAKASKKDRGADNVHPTVKPTDLMAYLCRLVTPPGGTVLDPFMGSGSTGKAAMREGFRFIGVDMTSEYIPIATARIRHALDQMQPPPAPLRAGQLDLLDALA
jgi:DNA methylase